jgi:hypothetical protein
LLAGQQRVLVGPCRKERRNAIQKGGEVFDGVLTFLASYWAWSGASAKKAAVFFVVFANSGKVSGTE